MFEKRHRITLLFNANKAYDRQVVEGVGEYLQASQLEWDIFIEEDFRARIENIKEWLGDGVIADYDDPEIEKLLADVHVPIVGVGGSYHQPEQYPPVHYIATDNAALVESAFLHLKDLARYQQLVKTNLVSRQELDTQQSLVVESAGTVKADEAAVASAQLQLDWTRITAPIDGRVGLKQVDIGNQISSGDTTGIVVLTQTHPIDVVFTLPESSIATVVQAQKAGKALSVEAWDRTNKQKISVGELLSLDNQIDATTGTIKLKARFSNLDDALFPNQFVNARLLVDTQQNAVVIPAAALQMGNEGHFVWVLNDENKVSKHSVTPGIQDSQKVVISAGLSAGDRVVTDGIDRLTEGAKVEVVTASSGEQAQPAPRQSGKHGARS